jgi:hypothetical protein
MTDKKKMVKYWQCEQKCGARAVTPVDELSGYLRGQHLHPPDFEAQKVCVFLTLFFIPILTCFLLFF